MSRRRVGRTRSEADAREWLPSSRAWFLPPRTGAAGEGRGPIGWRHPSTVAVRPATGIRWTSRTSAAARSASVAAGSPSGPTRSGHRPVCAVHSTCSAPETASEPLCASSRALCTPGRPARPTAARSARLEPPRGSEVHHTETGCIRPSAKGIADHALMAYSDRSAARTRSGVRPARRGSLNARRSRPLTSHGRSRYGRTITPPTPAHAVGHRRCQRRDPVCCLPRPRTIT
jgi:hypothetical protein